MISVESSFAVKLDLLRTLLNTIITGVDSKERHHRHIVALVAYCKCYTEYRNHLVGVLYSTTDSTLCTQYTYTHC